MSHSSIHSRVLCGGGAAGHKSMSMIMNTSDPMLVDGNDHVVYTILDFPLFPTKLCHHIDISTTLMTETEIMRHYPRLPFRPAQCFTQGPRLASEATRRQTFPHRHHHLGASRRGTGTALRFPPPFHLPFADTLIQRSASCANWLLARSAYYVTMVPPVHPPNSSQRGCRR